VVVLFPVNVSTPYIKLG